MRECYEWCVVAKVHERMHKDQGGWTERAPLHCSLTRQATSIRSGDWREELRSDVMHGVAQSQLQDLQGEQEELQQREQRLQTELQMAQLELIDLQLLVHLGGQYIQQQQHRLQQRQQLLQQELQQVKLKRTQLPGRIHQMQLHVERCVG
jgi:predicted  nucleic acid-binding Zn-ribbon protein